MRIQSSPESQFTQIYDIGSPFTHLTCDNNLQIRHSTQSSLSDLLYSSCEKSIDLFRMLDGPGTGSVDFSPFSCLITSMTLISNFATNKKTQKFD